MAHKGIWVRSGEGYFSTPDHADFDITGNISLRAELVHGTWRIPNATQAYVITKWDSATNNRSYRLIVNPDGTLSFSHSPDGTAIPSIPDSTVAVPRTFVPTKLAIRADRNATTGDVTYYTAPSFAGPWTQLGTTVASTPGNIFSSTADVILLNDQSVSTVFQFREIVLLKAEVYNDVTLIAHLDVDSTGTVGASTVDDNHGHTWTKNGTAYIGRETYTLELEAPEGLIVAKTFPGIYSANMDKIDPIKDDIDEIEKGWTQIAYGEETAETTFDIDLTAAGKFPPGTFDLYKLWIQCGISTGPVLVYGRINGLMTSDLYRWGYISFDAAGAIQASGHSGSGDSKWAIGRSSTIDQNTIECTIIHTNESVIPGFQSTSTRVATASTTHQVTHNWGTLRTSGNPVPSSLTVFVETGQFDTATWHMEGFRI